MMANTGDIRFEVEYMPAALGEKIRGKEDEPWPGDYMKEAHFKNFEDAARFAIEAAQDDFFGCTTVNKAECEDGRYDWWEHLGKWEVTPETKLEDLDPETPDFT